MGSEKLTKAIPVAMQRFADCGPGEWWFVHHPDGFLIECGDRVRAEHIAREINAGRSALSTTTKGEGHE